MEWAYSRILRQATQWELRGYKRKLGRPTKNWTTSSDEIWRTWTLLNWDGAEELTTDRAEWRRRVVHRDEGFKDAAALDTLDSQVVTYRQNSYYMLAYIAA